MVMYIKIGRKDDALENRPTIMYKPSLSTRKALEQESKDWKEFLEVKS